MTDPDGIVYMNTIRESLEGCWEKFCWPALNRKAYEEDGWKPVMYKLTKVKDKPIKRENNI